MRNCFFGLCLPSEAGSSIAARTQGSFTRISSFGKKVMSLQLPVSLSAARSCFVTLPHSVDASLVNKQRAAGGALVLKLTWDDERGSHQAFVGWTGSLQVIL
jgi:hypothetical protein